MPETILQLIKFDIFLLDIIFCDDNLLLSTYLLNLMLI